jgi:copper transport protein
VGRRTIALALLGLLLLPAVASAHAVFADARPRPGAILPGPPARVRVLFDAPVESALLELVVRDGAGTVRSAAPVRDPDDDNAVVAAVHSGVPGRWTVRWRVLSGDGHPGKGTFAFAVHTAARPAAVVVQDLDDHRPLEVAGRLLAIAGLLGLLGLAVLRAWVVGPAWRSGGPRPPGSRDEAEVREAAAGALRGAAARWWRAWWALTAAAAVGLVLWLVGQTRALDLGGGDLGTLLDDTRWGKAWIVEAAMLAVVSGLALALARSPRGDDPDIGTGWAAALAVPPAVAACALSWSGHASSTADQTLNIGLDAVHSIATGVWLGGLVGLIALVPAARRALAPEHAVRLGAAVVVRFSALAITCVGLLVVTGVYRALVELSSLTDLVDTGYGRALLVKLGIFVVLLAGGAYNRLLLHPRLERAALGLAPDDRGAGAALTTSVAAELALAGALLVAVAVLISLPPPSG